MLTADKALEMLVNVLPVSPGDPHAPSTSLYPRQRGRMVPLLSIEAQVQPMVATRCQAARKKDPSASCTAISTQKRLHETLETVVNVLQAHEACGCATAARLAAP